MIQTPQKTLFGSLMLDASAVFNLLGCKEPESVLRALNIAIFIEQRTLAEIKRHPIPGFCHQEICDALFNEGLIQLHRMSSQEYETYLDLVSANPESSLGDGESAAIAVALNEKRIVILDDKKARRITKEKFPSIVQGSSLQMFVEAGSRAGWSSERTLSLIREARGNARMNIINTEQTILDALSAI